MRVKQEVIEWEKRVLLELYKDYRHIVRERRLPLRIVAITLTDSESFWAQWNPITRTILISRKLVLEHNWFQVQSILRHEMAHQLIDETRLVKNGAPHGEEFYFACQRLGVPEEYSKATVCLQSSNLDWREEIRDEISEKMLEKVRKLLSLASSSNEHEALSAMNKVREIYAKYNLEEIELNSKNPMGFAHLVINHGKKRIEAHQHRIVSILVEHFFVEVISTKLFDAASGDTFAGIEIVGQRENVLMAEYVYYFLLTQIDFFVREASQKKALSRVQKKSFRLGILSGFSEKLTEAEKYQTSSQSFTNQRDVNLIARALTQFKEDSKLEGYINQIYPRLISRGSKSQYIDNSVYSQGRVVGKSITLNKAVSDSQGNKGRLLIEK